MATIGTVEGVLRLRDEFTSTLNMAASQAAVAGKRMKDVGQQMTSIGMGLSKITLPMAAVGGAAIKAFGDFDAAMVKSLAIMGDVSDEMRGSMARAARDVAKEVEFSAAQAAESYFFLASAGLDAAQSIEALPRVARFAQAGQFDMARATDLLTDAQSALGLTIRDDVVKNMENMARVSDVLVKANTLANATVQQFSESLTTKAGAALRLVNKDIEEGVAVLAVFADQGVKGAEAGTRLDIVLRDLQRATLKNREEFDALGVSVFDSQGNIRNIADIIEQLESALEGMSDEQVRSTLMMLGFQDRSVAATASLLGFSGAIRQYEAELREAGGITEEVANKQLESLWKRLGLLKDAMTDAFITLGESLIPTLEAFVERAVVPAIEALGRVSERFAGLPEPVKAASAAVALLFAAIGPALVAGGLLLNLTGNLIVALPKLAGALKIAAVAAKAFWVSLGPIGIALIAVTAAVVGAREALRRFSIRAQKDIEGMVKSANRAGDAFQRMTRALRGELELTAKEFDGLRESVAQSAQVIRSHQDELRSLTKSGAIAIEHLRGAEGRRARDLQQLIQTEEDRLKQLRLTLQNARQVTEATESNTDAAGDLDSALHKLTEEQVKLNKAIEDANKAMGEQAARLRAAIRLADSGESPRLIQAMIREAERLGVAIDHHAVRKLAEMAIKLEDLETALEDTTSAWSGLAGAMIDTSLGIRKVADELDHFSDAFGEFDAFDIPDLSAAADSVEAIARDLMAGSIALGEARDRAVALGKTLEDVANKAARMRSETQAMRVAVLDIAAAISGSIDAKMGSLISSAANLVDLYQRMAESWAEMERSQKLMASLAMGQQVFGMGQQAGLWSGDRGTGRFGGGMGGDYADVGAMVGAIIGGLTPLGPVGAMIGGAIGGLIGGLIKRGADRAVGELTLESGELAIAATRVDEKLQGVFRDFMAGVAGTINEVMDMIGGEMLGMHALQVRIQKDLIHVYVNGMKTTFDEVEDAVNFAAAELLRTANLTGISDVMRQILSNTFDGADQLKQALQFGEWYERLGLDQVEIGILDGMRELRRAVNAAMELGLDVQPIIDHFVSSMGAMRDQILGIVDEESVGERIEREAKLFEAMRLMQIAELEIRKAGLEAQAAQVDMNRELMMADMLINRERLEVREQMLGIEGDHLRVQAGHAQAMAQMTTGSLRMLEAINAALEVLRSLEITQSDIDAAIARAMRNMRNAGQGANQAATDMERLAGILEQMEFEASLAGMSDYETAMARLARQFEEYAELAHGNAELQAALNAQLAEQGKILKQEEFSRIADVFREIMGTGRFTSDPFVQLALRFQDAIDTVSQGLEDGVVSAAQAAEWISRLNDEMERQAQALAQGTFVQLGDALLSFVDKYYGDAFAGEELRMRLEQMRFAMDLANMRMQLETLKATGLVAAELLDMIEDGIGFILANPIDWEEFFAGAGEAAQAVAASPVREIAAGINEQIQMVHDRMIALREIFMAGEITLEEYRARMEKLNRQLSLAGAGQLVAIEQLIASLWPLDAQVEQIEENMRLLGRAMNAGMISAQQYAEGLAILQGQMDELLANQAEVHPLLGALESLLASLFPVEAQIAQIEEQMALLAEALADGLIDADRYADAIAILNDRLSDIQTREVRREIDALIAELDALASESMRVVSDLQREISGLESFLDSLKTQHGSPAQSLAALESRIMAAAQSGDISQFQALSQQFLQMASGMFGTAGAGFLSRLSFVQDLGESLLEDANDLLQTELEHLAEINETQASILEANMSLLDLTQEQIDEIRARGLAQEQGLASLRASQEARHLESQDKMTKLEQAIDRLGDILAG